MRFDGVEIKVTLAGAQTRSAVESLHLPDRPDWRIYFCEDVTPGTSPATPLLDLGVVLRARQKPNGKDDATVKLRPSRRSQLTDVWLAMENGKAGNGDDWEMKVEADWSGERRVLAASCSVEPGEGVVHDEGGDVRSAESLFSPVRSACSFRGRLTSIDTSRDSPGVKAASVSLASSPRDVVDAVRTWLDKFLGDTPTSIDGDE